MLNSRYTQSQSNLFGMSENKIMHFLSKSPIIDDSFVVLTHCVNGI